MSADEHDTVTADVAAVKTEIIGIKSWMHDIAESVRGLATQIQARQQTNWGLVVAILTLLIGAIGYARIVVQLEIANSTISLITQQAETRANLNQVETEFREMDNIRNVQTASQQRTNSLLWKQAFGVDYPQEVYYPELGSTQK